MKPTCVVDGCGRPGYSRGLCTMHYERKRRTGAVGLGAPLYNRGRLCSIEGCDGRHQARGWCDKHYTRWRVSGDPLLERPVGVNVVPRRPSEPSSWQAVHHRLREQRGNANQFPCAHCGQAAKDWAYDHTDPNVRYGEKGKRKNMPYSIDLMRYIPLCRSCHCGLDLRHRSSA